MARHLQARSIDWQRQILDEHIRAKGLPPGDYALFFVTREGVSWPLPGTPGKEFEETSGYLVDRHGRVFSFWLGWDPARGTPTLTEWEEVSPEASWIDEPEYLDARQAMGLSAA